MAITHTVTVEEPFNVQKLEAFVRECAEVGIPIHRGIEVRRVPNPDGRPGDFNGYQLIVSDR